MNLFIHDGEHMLVNNLVFPYWNFYPIYDETHLYGCNLESAWEWLEATGYANPQL